MAKLSRGAFRSALMPAFLAAAALGASCSHPRSPIRIGVNDWPPCELWYVAEKQGFFGDLPVQIVRFSSWTDNMKSLPLGDVDVTHSTYFNALYYRDKGKGGKIILKSDTIVGGDGLVIGPDVPEPKELRGKTISVETGTDEHFLLYKALERYGLDEEDVSLVSLTSVEAAERFAEGKADACFTYEPYLSDAAKRGNGKVVFTTKDIPDTMIDVLVASDELLSKHPRDAARLVDAYYRAQRWVAENPREAVALMAKKEGMRAEDFAPFFASFTFFTREQNAETFRSAALRDTLSDMKRFLFARGLVKEDFPVADVVWDRAVR